MGIGALSFTIFWLFMRAIGALTAVFGESGFVLLPAVFAVVSVVAKDPSIRFYNPDAIGKTPREGLIEVFLRYLASAVTLGFWGPVGRVGPVVKMSASTVATFFGDRLVPAAIASSFSAIFRSPVAGFVFFLEATGPKGNVVEVLRGLVACSVAFALSALSEGKARIWVQLPPWSIKTFLFSLFLGAVAGAVAFCFRALMVLLGMVNGAIRKAAGRFDVLAFALVGAGVAWVILRWGVWEVGGHGEWLVLSVCCGHKVALAPALARVMASAVALNLGASGGIVSPTLTLGALYGELFAQAFGMGPTGFWATLGVAGALSAMFGVPFTSAVLVSELSGIGMLPWALLSSFSSLFVAELLGTVFPRIRSSATNPNSSTDKYPKKQRTPAP